ncbi:hypothetical protein WL1483_97 [Aeromonas schubertii]|uniref:Uncharacterized protein n=1 Tax=Aeromonas schubertii TaxID=652 RepID=A0A0S2SCV6_9GAMM|nr:hypothetical protein WL1483_97 [Aeromonas schubertii]
MSRETDLGHQQLDSGTALAKGALLSAINKGAMLPGLVHRFLAALAIWTFKWLAPLISLA